MGSSLASDLQSVFGARARSGVPVAHLTTFRVGGPADWLVDAGSPAVVVDALRIASAHGVGITILGGGSNVLVSDHGLRGIVLVVRGGVTEADGPDRVRADAGVTVNGLVRWTIARGLAGLEAWAGTPGTVGGGIHGNAHFQGRLLGDLVDSAQLASRAGEVRDVAGRDMGFGYDTSRLQQTGEVLLRATFRVSAGDPAALRGTARESLHYRKRTQPLHMPSAGCIFRNPDPAEAPLPPGVPASAGALVDRAGLKGLSIGGARVSRLHGNFIVNEGNATARDIRALVERCKREVAARFGVSLHEEIVYLGEFD